MWRDESGQPFARGYSNGDRHRIAWPDLGLFEFGPGSLVVDAWLDDGAGEPQARDAIARVLQPVILQALGWQALHASALALSTGVVAFCGRSGSGKSTLAYALAQRGFRQFADDAVLLDVSSSVVTALPLPFRPRLRGPATDRFRSPSLREAPDRRAAARLRAVIVLSQQAALTSPRAELVPAVPAFSALLTHAHCFDPAPGPGSAKLVEDLLAVARLVPVTRLDYPPDLGRLDETLDAVLAATPGGQPARAMGVVP